jgi:hypothetical protein
MEEASDRATVQLSELTNKYSEAQRNAQKAMALFKETRDENEVLKSNFEALKQASLLTSRRPRTAVLFGGHVHSFATSLTSTRVLSLLSRAC